MRQGRVEVNGEVCRELGTKVEPDEDTVVVDGRRLSLPETHTYVLLHKPEGVVTTSEDPRGRETVVDLLPDELPRLWSVGRLDRDSSGAILMTDDGDLTHYLTHPSYEARKRYRVRVKGEIEEGDGVPQRLRGGVALEDGYVTEPAEVRVVESGAGASLLEIVLTEGKNRQIRRMCRAVGLDVEELRRTAIGPVELEGLDAGEWRELTPDDVRALYREVDEAPAERAPIEEVDGPDGTSDT